MNTQRLKQFLKETITFLIEIACITVFATIITGIVYVICGGSK